MGVSPNGVGSIGVNPIVGHPNVHIHFHFFVGFQSYNWFQYFTNNTLSQFWWRFLILHKPFFLFGTESTMWLRKLKGRLVGVRDGTNLGWIPTGNLLSQFHPKIPMIRRCSTILPCKIVLHLLIGIQLGKKDDILGSIPNQLGSICFHPKSMPSQTPTNHPYGFFWNINSSAPKRKVWISRNYLCIAYH